MKSYAERKRGLFQKPQLEEQPLTEPDDEDMEITDLRQIQKEQRAEKRRIDEEKRRNTPGPSTESSQTETMQEPANKSNKIPPIIINNAGDWTMVSNRFKTKKIGYTKAKMTAQGVAITPNSIDDYRAMARLLKEDKKEFHTFSLPEDKKTRTVIGRLPDNLTEEEIRADLIRQGVTPCSVQRMKSRKDKKTLPLVLVQVEKEDKAKIYNIKTCCNLMVRVEAQRQQPGPSQCHRCQKVRAHTKTLHSSSKMRKVQW